MAIRYLAIVLTAWAMWTPAAKAGEFDALKGQNVRVIIGGRSGAGTDVSGRALVAAMGKVVPEATFRVQTNSVGAGAGAVKELFEARGNLVTVGIFGNGPIYAQLLASAVVPYDVARLQWIGSLVDGRRALAVRKRLGAPGVEALRAPARQPVAATSEALAPTHVETLLLNAILGLHMKAVPGFSDAQIEAMLLAGDADIRVAGAFQLGPMIESGDLVAVLRFSSGSYPESMRGLPTIRERALPNVPQELVLLLETLNRLGRPFAAAPDTAPAVVAALRAAFEIAARDPDYLAATAREETPGEPTPGAELALSMDRLFKGPSEIGALMRAWRDCGARMADDLKASCN